MQFDKITISDDGVAFEWEKAVAVGTTRTEREESSSAPDPKLPAAMAAFKPYVGALLGLSDDVLARLEIRTAHLKVDEKTDLRTLQLVCILSCPNAEKKTTTFTTPLMRDRGDTEGGYFLEEAEMELIDALEDAATGFVERGERAQPELFPPQQTETNPEASDEPKRRAKGKGKKGKTEAEMGGAPEWNPAGDEATDEAIREALLRAERDVPIDAIAQFTSSEREAAGRWSVAQVNAILAQSPNLLDEPECVKRSATLPLQADEWTAPIPPRLTSDAQQEIAAAKEHDLREAR